MTDCSDARKTKNILENEKTITSRKIEKCLLLIIKFKLSSNNHNYVQFEDLVRFPICTDLYRPNGGAINSYDLIWSNETYQYFKYMCKSVC